MPSKLITLIFVFILVVTSAGCRKKAETTPPPAEPNKTQAKTQADYDAQAKKDINSVNMQAELEKLEKDIDKEAGTRP
jgi:nitrous oxide reductase accessory protein NosL